MEPTLVLTSLLPVGIDLVKRHANRIISGRKITVDEEVKILQAETERLKALAELDKPETNISKWVADFRAAFRYMFCAAILVASMLCVLFHAPEEVTAYMLDLLSGVTFFLIGHRTYAYIMKR